MVRALTFSVALLAVLGLGLLYRSADSATGLTEAEMAIEVGQSGACTTGNIVGPRNWCTAGLPIGFCTASCVTIATPFGPLIVCDGCTAASAGKIINIVPCTPVAGTDNTPAVGNMGVAITNPNCFGSTWSQGTCTATPCILGLCCTPAGVNVFPCGPVKGPIGPVCWHEMPLLFRSPSPV
jgi:hypothetical protein